MDDLTLNLIKFSLNLRTIQQNVASENIAGVGLKSKSNVNFDDLLSEIKNQSRGDMNDTIKALNDANGKLRSMIVKSSTEKTKIEEEHLNSTKAMIEYQSLIEALNRRMKIKSIIYGG